MVMALSSHNQVLGL